MHLRGSNAGDCLEMSGGNYKFAGLRSRASGPGAGPKSVQKFAQTLWPAQLSTLLAIGYNARFVSRRSIPPIFPFPMAEPSKTTHWKSLLDEIGVPASDAPPPSATESVASESSPQPVAPKPPPALPPRAKPAAKAPAPAAKPKSQWSSVLSILGLAAPEEPAPKAEEPPPPPPPSPPPKKPAPEPIAERLFEKPAPPPPEVEKPRLPNPLDEFKPRMPLEPKPPRAETWSFEDDASLSLAQCRPA